VYGNEVESTSTTPFPKTKFHASPPQPPLEFSVQVGVNGAAPLDGFALKLEVKGWHELVVVVVLDVPTMIVICCDLPPEPSVTYRT
jgi:hypothetical protein